MSGDKRPFYETSEFLDMPIPVYGAPPFPGAYRAAPAYGAPPVPDSVCLMGPKPGQSGLLSLRKLFPEMSLADIRKMTFPKMLAEDVDIRTCESQYPDLEFTLV